GGGGGGWGGEEGGWGGGRGCRGGSGRGGGARATTRGGGCWGRAGGILSRMEFFFFPAPLSPPSRDSTASVPITAIERVVFASGSVPPSFFNRTIDSCAASSARARWAALPFTSFALSTSTYGCSKSPSSNFARSTRATAAS